MRIQILTLLLWPVLCAAVEIPDQGLSRQVRQTLGKERSSLQRKDFDGLRILEADRKTITRLDGLGALHDLELLQLANNQITDLNPLRGLRHLDELDLRNNDIADLTPLVDLNSLRELYLQTNKIRDLTALA